jgi:acrylyl-CoA reductase (NADPH)
MFDALVIRDDPRKSPPSISRLSTEDLPARGDVLVRVTHSSLNYKDALAVTGKGKIVRAAYPFVPGIDLAGQVEESESERFKAGDWIIGTGGGLGESYWGGYSGVQRVDSSWLVPLPDPLTAADAMTVGTAGLTSMLSLLEMERHDVVPESGRIVVSGASGGVGSFAVLLLSRAGYRVVASTGKREAGAYLRALGAEEIIDRSVLAAGSEQPLESAKWAGAVDAVGGATLEAILSQTDRHGAVASCGLAGSASLNTTVFPFILRGVRLLGIDTNTCPLSTRLSAWRRLADMLDRSVLDAISETVPLSEVPARAEDVLAGRVRGRLVVSVASS